MKPALIILLFVNLTAHGQMILSIKPGTNQAIKAITFKPIPGQLHTIIASQAIKGPYVHASPVMGPFPDARARTVIVKSTNTHGFFKLYTQIVEP